jgi:hypothetical protein
MSSSDPYDPSKRIVRKIVVSSNDWVSIMDGGSPAVIFVPRGYCWVESISPETRDSSELDSRDYGPVCCAPTHRLKWCHFTDCHCQWRSASLFSIVNLSLHTYSRLQTCSSIKVSLGLIEGFAITMPWTYFGYLFGGLKK